MAASLDMGEHPMNNQQFIRELVLKSAQGDVAAFQELYQTTRQRAWFVALSITKNEHDAQDILQESYLKAYQSLSQLEKPESFESWLGQITANKAKNYISRKKPDSFADYGDENAVNWQEETDTEFLPDKNLDQAEAKALIAALISELPEDQRLVVLMRYYDDMEVAAVAAALNVPEGTVKSRLARARKKLAAMLQQAQDKGIALHAAAPIPLLAYFIQLIGFEENPGDRLPPLIGLAAAGAATATAAAASSATTIAGSSGAAGASGLLIKGVAIAAATAIVATGAVSGVYIYRSRAGTPPSPPAVTEPTALTAPVFVPSTVGITEPESEANTVEFQPRTVVIARTNLGVTQSVIRNPATQAPATTNAPEAAATTTEPAATTAAQTTERTTRSTAPRPTFTQRETTATTTTTTTTTTETTTTAATTAPPPITTPEPTTTTTTTTTRRPYSELFQINGSTIQRYLGDEEIVVIPQVINGVTMRHLSNNAFAGSTARRVELPYDFCCIRNRSFANMPNLEEIVIPASVGIIFDNAFDNSPNVVIVTPANSTAYHFAIARGIPVRLIP